MQDFRLGTITGCAIVLIVGTLSAIFGGYAMHSYISACFGVISMALFNYIQHRND